MDLLDTLYQQRRQTPEDWRLLVQCRHPGFYRIMPACGYEADAWPEHVRVQKLARGQAEMHALGRWLCERWPQEKKVLALAESILP